MFDFKKQEDGFLIIEDGRPYTLQKGKRIIFSSLNKTKYLIKDLNYLKKKSFLNPELVRLCVFASNLNSKDFEAIIDQIINQLNFDNILYRPTNDNKLSELMNKKYSYIIEKFSKEFKINFKIIKGTIGHQDRFNSRFLKVFLKKLNKYQITVILNLVQISKSVILSYNFVNLNLNQYDFLDLSNFENDYNVNRWGQTDENISSENEIKKKMKNITIFLKELKISS